MSDAAGSNVPSRLTRLVGRDAEIQGVASALSSERLITLIGSSGVGKSSVALRVAGDEVHRSDTIVRWVDLATVAAGAPVDATVLAACGAAEVVGRKTRDAIAGLVGTRSTLLVFDNCEHVVERCAHLAAWLLGRCSALRLLTTSQEPLRCDGEVVWRVPPLRIDDATELLYERATRARPGVGRDQQTTAALRRISVRLDGIPLALELAAGRLRMTSPEQLADELDRRLMVLAGGARASRAHHHTLRASIEWSYALMPDDEQRVLQRLSVFVGPFPLQGAEVVGGSDDFITNPNLFDVVAELVDRSLVAVDEAGGVVWYRLLESVRAYANEQLEHSCEKPMAQAAHAAWVARWCESHPGATSYTDAWYADVRRLTPTIRAALAWSLEHDLRTASRIISHARPLWTAADAADIGDRVLGPLEAIDERAWARCAAAIAEARLFAGDFAFLDDVLPRAQVICERDGDWVSVVRCRLYRLWLRSFEPDPYVEIADLAERAGTRMEFHVAIGLAAITAAMQDARRGRELLGVWRAAAIPADGRAAAAGECQVAAMVELVTSANLAHHGEWTRRGFELLDATVPPLQRTFVLGLHAEGALYRLDHDALAAVVRRAGELDLDWEPHRAKLEVLGRLTDVAVGHPLAPHELAAATIMLVSAAGVINLALDAGDATMLDGLDASVPGDVGPLWPLARGLAAWIRNDVTADELLRHSLDPDRGLLSALALVALADRARQASASTEAIRLAAAAEAQFDRIGFRWRPTAIAAALAAVRRDGPSMLGDEAYERAAQEGRRLDLTEAIEYCRRAHGARHRPRSGWASLTPTERRVVELVCEGHANAAIAKRMLVSEATVKTHLVHVFRKLSVTSRAQLVALAVVERPAGAQ